MDYKPWAQSKDRFPSPEASLLKSTELEDTETLIPKLNPSSSMQSLIVNDKLQASISSFEKIGSGAIESYIVYTISTKTAMSEFLNPESTVKRRYNEFIWLRKKLKAEHPACILPPLPDKQRKDFLDRFSPEFVSKRKFMLQKFLDHVCLHPILQKSESTRMFLESSFLPSEKLKRSGKSMDNLSDTVLNAFSKLKQPQQTFVTIKSTISALDEHFRLLDSVGTKMQKHLVEIAIKYAENGLKYNEFGESEVELQPLIEKFAQCSSQHAKSLELLAMANETHLISSVQEYLAYCRSVKVSLKVRDQKQIDNEDLNEYLRNAIVDREKLASCRPGHSPSLGNYVTQKLDKIKGIDQVRSKEQRLSKLDSKILELQAACESSKAISLAFNGHLVKEIDFFNAVKKIEVRDSMKQFVEANVTHHHEALDSWSKLLKDLEQIK